MFLDVYTEEIRETGFLTDVSSRSIGLFWDDFVPFWCKPLQVETL